MDKKYLQSVYSHLETKNTEYYHAYKKKDKKIIESSVRNYARNIKSELYIELNENSASGLFEPGFFESDMSRSLRILREKI